MTTFENEYDNRPGKAKSFSKYIPFTININDGKTPTELKERWLKLEQFKDVYIKILSWIDKKETIPYKEIPTIELSNYNKSYIKFRDLRGIDLSNLNLTKLNLSYCILDYANLENTICKETRFQNSSLNNANLDGSIWTSVQATPISMINTSFRNGEINTSYIMEGNCSGANFVNTKIKNIDFVGCILINVQFTNKDIEYDKDEEESFKRTATGSIFYD